MSNTQVSRLSGKQWLLILGVACSFAGSVGIGYFFTYYYQLGLEAFGFNDVQLGNIISVFSSSAVVCYLVGGLLADKFPTHLLIHLCNFGAIVLGIVVCTIPGYQAMVAIYMVLGIVCTLFTSGAWMKLLVRVGTKEQEGRIFGYYYMMIGGSSVTVGIISSAVIAATEPVTGLRVLMVLYCILCLLSSLILHFGDKDGRKLVGEKGNTFRLKMIPQVLTNPMMICLLITSMGLTMATEVSSYVQPLMNSFFLVPTAVIAFIATFANQGMRFICAPLAGQLTSRLRTATISVQVAYLLLILPPLALLIVPWGPGTAAVVVLAILMLRGSFGVAQPSRNSMISESRIPRAARGTAVGIFSAVVTIPDAFMYRVGGGILEAGKNSEAAYKQLLIVFLAAAVALNAVLWIFMVLLKRRKAKEAVEGIDPSLEILS